MSRPDQNAAQRRAGDADDRTDTQARCVTLDRQDDRVARREQRPGNASDPPEPLRQRPRAGDQEGREHAEGCSQGHPEIRVETA